jgi:hypothetical protein
MTPSASFFQPSPALVRLLQAFVAAGAVALGAGNFFAPERIWVGALLAAYLLVGLALAGAVFVATHYASGAAWSVAFRRVPEAMAAVLPAAAVLLILLLATQGRLYPWARQADVTQGFKHWWLSRPFFLGRAVVFVAAWTALVWAILRVSRRQDEEGGIALRRKNTRLSVAFLVVFGITFWLASYDWVMSLEPEWYSTVFGIYNFAGLFSGGLAAVILLVVWLQSAGPLRGVVNAEHYHDLGKLLFGLTTFWMYIWFCQYMLIWYANIPEETAYFIRRQRLYWQPLFLLNLILNWVVPFFILLLRPAKRNPRALAKAAAVVLAGRWLDVYLMIIPPFSGGVPWFGLWELALTLGVIGLFLLLFLRAFRQTSPVPWRDPGLAESLHYHT